MEVQTDVKAGKLKMDKRKRIEEIQGVEIPGLLNAVAETSKQLEDLKGGLKDIDKDLKTQVDQVWEGLPDSTAKGSIDKLMKISTPKRGQLLENIVKLEFSLQSLKKRIREREKEVKELQEEIRLESLGKAIGKVHKVKNEFIETYKQAEEALEDLKSVAAECHRFDPDWLSLLSKSDSRFLVRDKFTAAFLNKFRIQNLINISLPRLVEDVVRWDPAIFSGNPFSGGPRERVDIPVPPLERPSFDGVH